MSLLEWIGIIAICLFFIQWMLNIYKSKNSDKHSKDPDYSKRQLEFNRMATAFDKLLELRNMKQNPHNEVISNVQSAIEDMIQSTVPLPKDAYASDYRSKYVDYTVIHYLASNIINSELRDIKPAKDELKIEWG